MSCEYNFTLTSKKKIQPTLLIAMYKFVFTMIRICDFELYTYHLRSLMVENLLLPIIVLLIFVLHYSG